MGAAFSPTIANIFLSTIHHRFVQTQAKQPLLMKRYIDDIFLIWQHSQEDLLKFLTALNSSHPSLRYTWNFSSSSTDYLDITIFKGPTFPITGLLDTKTFQKPKNLYQYLHHDSCHPPSVFKALIKGECIRYIRTNSSNGHYLATIKLLKQRLLKRQFPHQLIERSIRLVKYTDRQKYLKEPTQRLKPVFKCLPPPHFSYLKAIVLQRYQHIKRFAPTPRFIALRHKTIGQELIRSNIFPTDEQFVDIIMTIENNTSDSTTHISAGKLPTLRSFETCPQPCNNPRCSTCQHFNPENYFRSTSTGRTYPIRRPFSCVSRNIIYLITCTKCKKQYVGYTTTQLNQRMCRHRSNINNNRTIYICVHFNFPDHNIRNLSVQAIDTDPNTTELKRLERFWIHTLQTYIPKGLNASLGCSI